MELGIEKITKDDMNLNRGTEEGGEMIKKSISELGLGRSILLDKNNRVISGNKTLDAAIALGVLKVRVVDTDGSQLVAVKRKDLDLDTQKGREAALADNAVAKANIDFDEEMIDMVTEKFQLSREALGFDRSSAKVMTKEEMEAYDAENGVEPSTAVCPNCFTEFIVEDIDDEEE